MSTANNQPKGISKNLLDCKVFQLDHREDVDKLKYHRIRYHLRKPAGAGPHKLKEVSFSTTHIILDVALWDYQNNRLRDNAPNAESINAELEHIRVTVAEAIEAGMSQDEIRELMGQPPTRKFKPRTGRSDKGGMRLETAKRTLVQAGYTQRVTPKPETAEAEPAPELHPDPETNRILQRFGTRPITPLSPADLMPDPAASAPAAGVQVQRAPEYWLVVGEPHAADALMFHPRLFSEEEATRFAQVLALQSQQPQYIFHCKPTARVQVPVQIEQL